MTNLILFNKPFGVICQFREKEGKKSLGEFIDLPEYYPAGRLDHDSEGLVLLTNDGKLQARITEPKYKLPKTYQVQVEGDITEAAISSLRKGVELNDGLTRPAKISLLADAPLAPRSPPIRFRQNIPTSWIEMTIAEGRNRQIRRMTAAVGYPTLRLFRYQIGHWSTKGLKVGEWKMDRVNLPQNSR